MRGKKAIINVIAGLGEEIAAVICSFILPRLILTAFGSEYNGLTTSITQFLQCAVLLRAGIGGATRAALYKPLAERNKSEIDGIMRATDLFMKKIGLILAGGIVVFAAIYPLLVRNEFEWFFTFSLFLIISTSTFAESFFGITYLILLQADQKLWISSVMRTICYILNTSIAALLILSGCSIHIVKLGSAMIFVLYPIILRIYVKKTYHIDSHVKPINSAIKQRWDALWQQVSAFVMENVGTLVLTAFSTMLEVSVYSVYNMISNGIRRAVFAFSNGIDAALGNMIAKQEEEALRRNVSIVETILFSISTVVYTTALILVLQFVSVYTKGIEDVNYIRPAFAYLILISQFFNCVRIPYQIVIEAAGHFKQTKKVAIMEPIINIILAVIFVNIIGITGVAIGAITATIIRTGYYSVYMSRNLVKRSCSITLGRCIAAFGEAFIVFHLIQFLSLPFAENYLQWVVNAVITVCISAVVVLLGDILFYKRDVVDLFNKIKNILGKGHVRKNV